MQDIGAHQNYLVISTGALDLDTQRSMPTLSFSRTILALEMKVEEAISNHKPGNICAPGQLNIRAGLRDDGKADLNLV